VNDPATGRDVVVAGTYATAASHPVGVMGMLMSVPRGLVAGADIIVLVLMVGGAFAALEQTGALARLVASLVGRARNPRVIVIGLCLLFGGLGAVENMQEEIIALVPVLVVLSQGLGFGPLTALGMSVGAAVVGSAFGPTNPFQSAIALKIAGLPSMSAGVLRFAMLGAALALWTGWTLLRGDRAAPASQPDVHPESARLRDLLLLAIVLIPFVPYVVGALRWDWGFNELSALFLVGGLLVGVVAGQTLNQSAAGLLRGMESMLQASLFIGVARAISVVLTDGQVLDTIIHGLATPLNGVPGTPAALLMIPIQATIHIAVVSVSGQAVLTMPIMAPVADLVHVSRDAAVMAYQTGAGLMDGLTPTNGALLAMLLAARVDYGRWIRFALPGFVLVALVGIAGIVLTS